MENLLLKQTTALVEKDMALDFQGRYFSESELLDILADHISYLLENKLEFLFSSLYLMDVNETKVHEALHPDAVEPSNVVIAKLIIDREKKKAQTRLEYKSDAGDGWKD